MELFSDPPLWLSLNLIALSAGAVAWHLWQDRQVMRSLAYARKSR